MQQVSRQKTDPAMPREVWHDIEACLNRLKDTNRLVLHPKGASDAGNDDYRWVKCALERQTAAGGPLFNAVFATDVVLECSEIQDDALVPLSKALRCTQWQDRLRSGTLLKTESSLQNALRPFLRYARKVVLIDPYMTCRNDRFFNTVQHCANLLGRGYENETRGAIVIHAGDPMFFGREEHREPVADRLNRWEDALRPVVDYWGHSCQVLLWGQKPGGPRPHARYIITDHHCGVVIEHGLDFLPDKESSLANMTEWSVLGHKRVASILQGDYHHAKSPFKYLGMRKVSP